MELAGVVGRGGLAGGADGAGAWVAELVHGENVQAIEKVEAVGDQVEVETLAEANGFGDAKVNLEETGSTEAVAAEIAVATLRRTDAGNRKRGAVVGEGALAKRRGRGECPCR